MRADLLVGAERCRDFRVSSRLEWLDTNGAGAYAMGTVAGIRTRRYHSLLNAPLRAGLPTQVWLSAVEDTLELEGERYELAAHGYPGVVSPRGFEMLGEFRLGPHPCWLYRMGEASLAKEVLLVEGKAAVVVRYCCSEDAVLRLRPFVAGRGQHELVAAARSEAWETGGEAGHVWLRRGEASLHMRGDFGAFHRQPDWYYRFQYAVDRERGLDFEEDLFTPGVLECELRADRWAYFVCALNEDPGVLEPLELLGAIEAKERRFPAPRRLEDQLANAAEHYVFEQGGRKSVIAGYPWFTDWGRDTFISFPGLFLARGKLLEAGEVIAGFLGLRRDGLIPNRITDDGSTAEYNSIDATLWLYVAVWQWLDAGGDRERFGREFYAALRDMLGRLEQGTRYGIRCDTEDGLLEAGEPGVQLTWMDARVDGIPVTPRGGKAVEINALWYNALRLVTDWARAQGDFESEAHFGKLANRMIEGFTRKFWNERRECLFDVLGDEAVRPNQLFALSLPYPLVIRSKGEAILRRVEEELLTPVGLRTLSPADRHYRGRFEGGPRERDTAYHQGTVWPWLWGPYARACLRLRGYQPGVKEELRARLVGFAERGMQEGCLGQLPEVYDGDEPRREGGTPAQAWSVAEILALLRGELAF